MLLIVMVLRKVNIGKDFELQKIEHRIVFICNCREQAIPL